MNYKKRKAMNRIAFIICPQYTTTMPHLGIGYMRSIAEQAGYETKYIDFSALYYLDYMYKKLLNTWISLHSKKIAMKTFYTLLPAVINYFNNKNKQNPLLQSLYSYLQYEAKRMAHEIIDYGACIACFSIYDTTLLSSLAVAYELKKLRNDIRIIFGGPFLYDERLRKVVEKFNHIVNNIVIGEGEFTLMAILNNEVEEGKNVIIAEPIKDLDKLPFPTFEGCNFNLYYSAMRTSKTWHGLSISREKILPIIGMRGCPFNCAFCDHHIVWKSYRTRSIDNVIEEIKYNKKKYDCNIFRFNDSLINSDIHWLEEFCSRLIDSKVGIYWYAHCRADKFSNKLAELMYKSGCRYLKFGIESGSQRVLNLMNKRITPQKAIKAIRDAYEAGIKTRASFIYAYPGESREELFDTIKFIRECMDKLYGLRIYNFIFMPCTTIENKAEQHNIKLINFNIHDDDFKEIMSMLPEEWIHPEINEEEIRYRGELMKQVLEEFNSKINNYVPYMFSEIIENKLRSNHLIKHNEVKVKKLAEINENIFLTADNGARIKIDKSIYNFIKGTEQFTVEMYRNEINKFSKSQDERKYYQLLIDLISCGILSIT